MNSKHYSILDNLKLLALGIGALCRVHTIASVVSIDARVNIIKSDLSTVEVCRRLRLKTPAPRHPRDLHNYIHINMMYPI